MKKARTKQREDRSYFSVVGEFGFVGARRWENGTVMLYTRGHTTISAASAQALGEFLRGGPPEKPVTRKPGSHRKRI